MYVFFPPKYKFQLKHVFKATTTPEKIYISKDTLQYTTYIYANGAKENM